MKNSLAMTSAALTGLASQIVLAQTGGPLIPAKLNVVVPKGPMQLGQSLPVKVEIDQDTIGSPLWAYQIAVVNTNDAGETISNVTGMQGWSNSPSYAELGNGSSGSAFDARGDLILPNGQGASCSTGPPSDASFEFDTGNWTAGAYVIDVRLHVVGSSKPLAKAGGGADCLLPPFTNYSTQAITYVRIDNTEPNATGTPELFTTAVPVPTTVDAYGRPQSVPTQAPSGGAAHKSMAATLGALTVVGAAVLAIAA